MSASRLAALMAPQAAAAAPDVHAWVAASAGTGKTQVLSARVLRLLLQGTPPAAILCLTFTKLAAAEMQNRVFGRLAAWAACDEAALAADLRALGAGDDPAVVAAARRLFAEVLDAPQGLAVQTIHAFAQGLIASFPVEAGVAPGFATLDDRDGAVLRRRLLTEAIERADAEGDEDFLADLATLSIAGGEARLGGVLARLAGHGEGLAGLSLAGIEPMLRRGFGLATDGDGAAALAAAMAGFDAGGVERLARAWEREGKASFTVAAGKARAWLLAPDRAAAFAVLKSVFLTAKDEPRSAKAVPAAADRADPSLRPLFEALTAEVLAILGEQMLYAAAAHAACHLRIGKRLAADWGVAKARAGVIDYDDMIAAAQRLLEAPGAAEWVRYKLDQRIDHVLVDEAQDTNDRQWQIVGALVAEFFDGEGARDVQRTLFVVGDYKQAIFGFQGSDPRVYADKREHFEGLASDGRELWRDIALSTNFRSVPAVLDVVDAFVGTVGPGTLDRSGLVPPHAPHRADQAGAVTLWPPVTANERGDAAADDGGDDAAADTPEDDGDDCVRAPKAEIQLAHRIAATIASWFDPRAPLVLPARGTRVRPQDILVLVRNRSAFSNALVAALHVHGVPVAGVDRLKLKDPLAVADLLALVRFALQPGDDLTLAALLVSPFGGLDQATLFALADGREGSLWQQVRASDDPAVVEARAFLLDVLGFADFAAPYEFFERVLSGPLGGRRRLLARLGAEARDAIDAVLDQALAFEVAHAPSLQGFLAFVEADDIEIKRDPDAPLDAVRLMTVHGAKGLQAPVVILADATRAQKPDTGPLLMSFDGGPPLPVFLASRKGLTGPLARALAAAEEDAAREHCRLLYVALTRAEDLLFIGGALAGTATEAPEGSWHAIVAEAMAGLETETTESGDWPGALVYHAGVPARRKPEPVTIEPAGAWSAPAWVAGPPPAEARPPRPLAPSAMPGDDVSAPPGRGGGAAARRGMALHALFERLPDVAPERRRAVGEAWAQAGFPELDAAALVATVLGVMGDPRFAAVFDGDALVEAPLAAVVGGVVISGKVDRLRVDDERVLVVDFKTGGRVPGDAAAIEPYHLRQMAAYAAALGVVFPGRTIEAALLYTEGPALIAIPDAILALHAPQAEVALQAASGVPIFPD